MMFTNNTTRKAFSKDPAVVNFKGNYYLYHTIPPNKEETNGYGIGIAQSNDLENWTVTGNIPSSQECEKNGICAPGAIVIDNVVHLFYQTYGNGIADAICHAFSFDGVNFEKNKTNPVYAPSNNWCCGRAIDADVCIFKGKLFLYIATRDHDFRIQKIGGAYADINSDFSVSSWTELVEQNLLVPELQWEGECIEAPACIVNNDVLFMFYAGSYNCTPQQIGCAYSHDGIFFRRLSDKPFLENGKIGEWNECESGHPFAFRDNDGRCYLFYQGSSDNGETWYISKREFIFNEQNQPVLI